MEKDRRLYFRAAMTLLTMLLTTATWAESAIGSIQYNSTGGYYEIGSAGAKGLNNSPEGINWPSDGIGDDDVLR